MLVFLKKIFGFNIFESLASRSGRWRTTRKNHLASQPVCQVCGTKKKLVVHHIIPVSVNKEKENDYENLITLCNYNNCHFLFGHFCNWKKYNIEVRLDAEQWRKKIERFENLESSSESF